MQHFGSSPHRDGLLWFLLIFRVILFIGTAEWEALNSVVEEGRINVYL